MHRASKSVEYPVVLLEFACIQALFLQYRRWL